MTEQIPPGARLVAEWQQARAELRAIEEAEHPPVTDRFGRVWTWKDRDLYVHDQMAWTPQMIERGGLPSAVLAGNPNYDLCAICTQNWGRKP
jgi:hypothetical protein